MNKKIYTIASLFFILAVLFSFQACSDDDDDIDYVWKERNEKLFADAAADYPNMVQSKSGNGFVRFKTSDVLTTKTAVDGTIQFSDSVVCLYIGWYLDADGNKYVFDSTVDRNNVPSTFAVNGVIDGWVTILQTMKEGDEREICVPYQLGYGTAATSTIPAYTTLFFNIKVLKVIPVNPNEF